MLNRRRFIRYLFLAAGGLSVGLSAGFAANASRPFEKLIKNILITDLKGLKVNLTDIEAYAREAASKNVLGSAFTQLFAVYHLLGIKRLSVPFYHRYDLLRTGITSNFLFSTDFFLNKMDEQKKIKYSGSIHNSFQGACSNPFSGLYYRN